jgi:multicomponent K+:H+ antiporter subunit E
MSTLKKLVPAPVMSAVLAALWLVLARSASPGHLVIGVALGFLVPIMTANLRPSTVHVRRPLIVVRFALLVAYDVLHSNVLVARDVIFWRRRRPQSAFVVIPLDLRDPLGLAVLAMVTTVVPGTVWSELALDRSALMLHVWDVADEASFVARYKSRYEKPIRGIFE